MSVPLAAARPHRRTDDERAARRLAREEYVRQEDARLKPGMDLVLGVIDAGYRAMALRLHPDKGGSPAAMRQLAEMVRAMRKEARGFVRNYSYLFEGERS